MYAQPLWQTLKVLADAGAAPASRTSADPSNVAMAMAVRSRRGLSCCGWPTMTCDMVKYLLGLEPCCL